MMTDDSETSEGYFLILRCKQHVRLFSQVSQLSSINGDIALNEKYVKFGKTI
jgi:hypothetical protein